MEHDVDYLPWGVILPGHDEATVLTQFCAMSLAPYGQQGNDPKVGAGALAAWASLLAALGASVLSFATLAAAAAEPAAAAGPLAPLRDYSGWRGGISIAFGTPSRDIADVTELGYEINW